MSITTTNFKRKLAAFTTSAKRNREAAQEFLEFGLNHYQTHGDCAYLTQFMTGCVGVKSLPTQTLKAYIKAHANIVWTKRADGKMGFRKATKGADVEVKPVTAAWYDWEGATHNKVTEDRPVSVYLQGVLKRLEDGKGIKHDISLQTAISDIKALVANIEQA